MSIPFDLNGGLTLQDAQGRTVGVVLANQAFEGLKDENTRLREEATRLQTEVVELRRSLDAARQELKDKAAITAERDGYLKSLHALTWKDFTFTQEEIDDLDKNGVPFDEKFIEELERDLRSLGSPDA